MALESKKKQPSAAAESPTVGIHYSCDSCFKDISQVLRIQCAECEEVDLCAECFGNGVEFQNHLKQHSYRIIPPLTSPIYSDGWRADEELLLIEGCESQGMGNWEDIAEHVGAKDQWQCQDHYLSIYLSPHIPPIKKPSVPISELAAPQPSLPANHEIAGYMPLRGEFETEFENDFEAALKDFLFNEDDSPVETKLKLSLLQAYSGILDSRHARRQFITDHNLLEFKKQQQIEKSRSKEDRDIFLALKPFARFLSAQDFSALHRGLVREEEIKRRIYQLQEYRRNGLRSLAQVSGYETEKKMFECYLKGGLMNHATPPLTKSPPPLGRPYEQGSSGQSLQQTQQQPPQHIRKASAPLNVSNADGVELLSEKERQICSLLRLYPRLYLTIKDTLIRENLKYGGLKRAQARAAIKIDVNKTSKLYDFFSSAGWISPPSTGE